jgi:hypothetical protein
VTAPADTEPGPRAPAAAYAEMERLLGADYFLRQPPRQGVAVTVRGVDGVPTTWHVSFEMAAALRPNLAHSRTLQWMAEQPYNMKGTT